MKKIGCKLFSVIMAVAMSGSMILPERVVSASQQPKATLQKQYFPNQAQSKKVMRKTEPAEWNKKEIKVYKFEDAGDAVMYILSGGNKYYNATYFKNPEKIKLTPVESGILFLSIQGDNEQAGAIYDSNKKLIQKVSTNYVKADVKAGETYYVEFPRNCKEGTISAYILENEFTSLSKEDILIQKGEDKETYHTFKMKKRGIADLLMTPMVEDGGSTSYKLQKNQNGKWSTIGSSKTFKATTSPEVIYALSSGTYRLVLKASKKQANSIMFEKQYVSKKKVAYKKSKAKNLNAYNIYTTEEKAARWYKVTLKSTKKTKKIQIATVINEGGFKFSIYKKGQKKPIKTIKTSPKKEDKTVKLSKKAGTYYIKVSKLTKKTNGYYSIDK